jgi:hypothetical protein
MRSTYYSQVTYADFFLLNCYYMDKNGKEKIDICRSWMGLMLGLQTTST